MPAASGVSELSPDQELAGPKTQTFITNVLVAKCSVIEDEAVVVALWLVPCLLAKRSWVQLLLIWSTSYIYFSISAQSCGNVRIRPHLAGVAAVSALPRGQTRLKQLRATAKASWYFKPCLTQWIPTSSQNLFFDFRHLKPVRSRRFWNAVILLNEKKKT